jgi:alpha-tubulin suppressor-like RCC1 family protein
MLATFGYGDHGQLGHHPLGGRCSVPAAAVGLPGAIASVSLGGGHSSVATCDGAWFCFADRKDFPRGHPRRSQDLDGASAPFRVTLEGRGPQPVVLQVGSGALETMATTAAHQLFAYSLADGRGASPARLVGTFDAPVRQLACGALHTLLLLRDGRVFSFGSGPTGALGHGAARDYLQLAAPRVVRPWAGFACCVRPCATAC